MTLTRSQGALRPAGPGDIDAIARLWHQGWIDGHVGHVPDTLLPHRLRSTFRERVPSRIGRTTVATDGTTLLGFVIVHDDELEQLYVAAQARSTGVAGLLLRHGEREIAAGSQRAWLAVVAGNARARRFYERNGWSDAGAFEYLADASTEGSAAGREGHPGDAGGTIAVPSRRYEKDLTA